MAQRRDAKGRFASGGGGGKRKGKYAGQTPARRAKRRASQSSRPGASGVKRRLTARHLQAGGSVYRPNRPSGKKVQRRRGGGKSRTQRARNSMITREKGTNIRR
jgi:hypothetical protein